MTANDQTKPDCGESSLTATLGTQPCQMTMGEYRNYYKCGRPSKGYLLQRDGTRLFVCGIHARRKLNMVPNVELRGAEQASLAERPSRTQGSASPSCGD